MSQDYDVVIIGQNLTALVAASRLVRAGHKVAVVGGRSSSQQGPGMLPDIEGSEALLKQLSSLMDQELAPNRLDAAPVVLSDRAWRPFAGFGDHQYGSVDELSFYNHSSQWQIPGIEPLGLMQLLKERLPNEWMEDSEVSEFSVEGTRVTHCLINGERKLTGKVFIFTDSLKQLTRVFKDDQLSPRHRNRLAKFSTWTGVELQFVHKPQPTDQAPHFVLPNDGEPILGWFYQHGDERKSQWLTLVPSEYSEDHDLIGKTLKNMKKSLHKGFPTFADSIVSEKISISEDSFGFFNWLSSNKGKRSLEWDNFLLASPMICPRYKGTLAALSEGLAAADEAQNLIAPLSASCYPTPN